MLAANSSPPSLPTLPPHLRHVLSRFLALDQCPYALAQDLACDIFEAIEQLAHPAVQSWLAFHTNLIAHRLRTHAHHTLEEVCTTSPNPIERRRAAARLIASLNYIDHATRRTTNTRARQSVPPHSTPTSTPVSTPDGKPDSPATNPHAPSHTHAPTHPHHDAPPPPQTLQPAARQKANHTSDSSVPSPSHSDSIHHPSNSPAAPIIVSHFDRATSLPRHMSRRESTIFSQEPVSATHHLEKPGWLVVADGACAINRCSERLMPLEVD